MDPIYIAPTCVGLAVTAWIIVRAYRRRQNVPLTAVIGAFLGLVAWYVALFLIIMGIGMRGLT